MRFEDESSPGVERLRACGAVPEHASDDVLRGDAHDEPRNVKRKQDGEGGNAEDGIFKRDKHLNSTLQQLQIREILFEL